MKKIILLIILIFLNLNIYFSNSFADEYDWNIEIDHINEWNINRNSLIEDFKNEKTDFSILYWWNKWIKFFWLSIAESLKNFFFIISWIYLLIISIKIIFSEKAEDEASKFKKWLIWISVWVMIMQWAYVIEKNIFDKNINETTAINFSINILNPIIWTLEILASVFFLWIAIFAAFKMISAGGNEDKVKQWKSSIFYALIWFFIIMFAKTIVESSFWKIDEWLKKANPEDLVVRIFEIINWINGFLALIVLVLIIYTWWKILLSRWEEDVVKKAKSSIISIVIWLFIISVNYFIATIFLIPESTI